MYNSNCCFLTFIQISQEACQVVWYFNLFLLPQANGLYMLTPYLMNQEAGQMVWYSHLFQNFPQFFVIHAVKGFGIVNKAELEGFLELSCFFEDPVDVGNLISGSSAFSKTNLNIWKVMDHLLLKNCLGNFDHYFTSMGDECNCAVV